MKKSNLSQEQSVKGQSQNIQVKVKKMNIKTLSQLSFGQINSIGSTYSGNHRHNKESQQSQKQTSLSYQSLSKYQNEQKKRLDHQSKSVEPFYQKIEGNQYDLEYKRVQKNNFGKIQCKAQSYLAKQQIKFLKSRYKESLTYQALLQEQYIDMAGNLIKGKKIEDKLHGLAYIKYPDGATFKGVFVYGVRQFGEFVFSNGDSYKGQFNQSEFEGDGQLIFVSGKKIKGKWNNSLPKPNTAMEVYYTNGQVYFGPLNYRLKKHGIGSLVFPNKDQYRGQFCNGDIIGKGIYIKNNDQEIGGFWLNGEYKGDKMTNSLKMLINSAIQQSQNLSSLGQCQQSKYSDY